MRRALQLLYAASGMLAAFFMVLMATLVVAQIGARLAGTQVPSADDFARLSMAASAFLGLAFALRTGAHIRVTLCVERAPPRLRAALEVACLAPATAVCAWFAWADRADDGLRVLAVRRATRSGQVPMPKWLPLAGMTLGIALVAVAFLDDLIDVLRGRVPAYRAPSQFTRTRAEPCLSSETSSDPRRPAARAPRRRAVDRGVHDRGRRRCRGALHQHQRRGPAGHHGVRRQHRLGAHRAAALHLDGRDPVPHPARRARCSPASRRGSSRLPGRLAHTNVLGCGIFAAVSGSSTATTATIGRITVPELTRRGYDDKLVLGSLAGSGTLGILIPPSIIMIVYGVAADVPITHLFIAGVLPGILLMALFSGWSWAMRSLHPGKIPPPEPARAFRREAARRARAHAGDRADPGVIGSLYFGIATATEAAGVGVVGALAIAGWSPARSTWRNFRASVYAAVRTTA